MDVMVGILVAYILGSIPFCFVLGKLCRGIDLRKEGSGNVGATNLYRLCGLKFAFAGFILDFFKGYFALFLIKNFLTAGGLLILFSAVAVILGHVFPVFLKFKGGKGVSTAAGVLFFLDYRIFLISLAVFILVFLATKIVSLSSVASTFSLVVSAVVFYFFFGLSPEKTIFFACVGVLIIVFHRENIKRLFEKREKKIL